MPGPCGDEAMVAQLPRGYPAELLIDGRWRTARGEVVGPDRVEYPRLLTGYRAAHPHTSARTTAPIVHFVLTDRP